MNRLASLLLCSLAVTACGDDGHSAAPTLIRQDEASDEVFLSMVDEVDQGDVTVSDADAAHMTFPTDGTVLARQTPPTFTWELPSGKKTPRHGTITGLFVWVNLAGPGMSEEVDVLSLTTTSWTPDAEAWAKITQATGEVTMTVTTAYARDGIVTEGPFQPTQHPGFTVGP